MRFLRKLLLPVLAVASLALAQSSTGNSVLVLLDPSLKKENFSIFFGDLESTLFLLPLNLSFADWLYREGLQADLPVTEGHCARSH